MQKQTHTHLCEKGKDIEKEGVQAFNQIAEGIFLNKENDSTSDKNG